MITLYDEHKKLTGIALFFVDIFVLWLASRVVALFLMSTHPEHVLLFASHPRLPSIVAASAVIYLTSFVLFGFYRTFRHSTLDQIFSKTLVGVFFGTMGLITLVFVFNIHGLSRLLVAIFSVTIFLCLSVFRAILFTMLEYYRKRGYNFKKVLIVGSRTRAQEMIDAIYCHPGAGYRVYGCLELDEAEVGKELLHGIGIIGTLESSFRDIMMNEEIDELVFAIPLDEVKDGSDYVALAEEIGVNIRVLPDWQIHKMTYHQGTASIYFDQFLGLPTLALTSIPQKETELFIKGALDIIGTLALIVVTAPIFVLTALIIKITSPGPILFAQTRSGLNGRKFTVYKFRSMVTEAEELKEDLKYLNEEDGPVFKIKADPRLTPFGKFIRKTSIDELPQLYNVLRGEMSLVGPRPPLPEEVALYKPWQRRRLSLKPGLTCIWQVKARNNTNFSTWMRMDLEYIDNWSIFLDLKLLALTVPAVLLATGR